MVTEIPEQYDSSDKLESLFNRMFPGEFESVFLVPNIPGLFQLKKQRFQFLRQMEQAKAMEEKDGERQLIPKKFLRSLEKVDAIEYYQAQMNQMEEKINEGIQQG
jgi:hypothetical protein